jgi:hypothetical protein
VVPNPDPVCELRDEVVGLLIGTPPQVAGAGTFFHSTAVP